jgi:hypothetical protein
MADEQDLGALIARGVRVVRRASAVVTERALRLGNGRDWAIVGAAICMLIAAILITALWTVTPKKRADGPSDEIIVVWAE